MTNISYIFDSFHGIELPADRPVLTVPILGVGLVVAVVILERVRRWSLWRTALMSVPSITQRLSGDMTR